jgi:hypothetical protein
VISPSEATNFGAIREQELISSIGDRDPRSRRGSLDRNAAAWLEIEVA